MNKPSVGSLFTGIGGFDLGLERAGWKVAWQVESNPFRQKVLRRHWPGTELRSDVRTDTDGLPRVDLICGGFPCQDLSVAGRRAGLDGERSGLFHEFVRVVRELGPTWVLVENVPGLLSSNQGKDMGIVINSFAECGYGLAFRVLDSKHFGVPQRRRRVYIVGHLGAPCPPEVLFEPESLRGDSAKGRPAGAEVANSLRASTGKRGTDDPDRYPAFIPEISRALNAKERYDLDTESFVARPLLGGQGNDRQDESAQTYIVNARQDPIVGNQPIDTDGHSPAVVQPVAGTVTGAEAHNGNSTPIPANYIVQPLRANRWGGSDSHGDEGNVVVRPSSDADRMRETPGLPAGLDATPDGPRYAALGDAVTVPVAEWIGRRILQAHLEGLQ